MLASPTLPTAVLDMDYDPARAARNITEAFKNLADALGIDPANKCDRYVPDAEHRATVRVLETSLSRVFGVEPGSFDAAGFLVQAGLSPQSVANDLAGAPVPTAYEVSRAFGHTAPDVDAAAIRAPYARLTAILGAQKPAEDEDDF